MFRILVVLLLGGLCHVWCVTASAAGLVAQMNESVFLEEDCEANFSLRAVLQRDPRTLNRAEARLLFHWQEDGSGYYLSADRRGAQFFKATKGRATALSARSPWQGRRDSEIGVTLQRRGNVMRCIANDVVLINTVDAQFFEGKAGLWSSGLDLSWQNVRYQPVQPIHLTDDFMRAQGEQDPWQPVEGKWSLRGIRGEPGVPPPTLAVNPFTYRGSAEAHGKALTVTGNWFWDNYSVAASVKPASAGAVGLCAYYKNPSNYVLFRWTSGLAFGKKQLLLLRDGKEIVLAQAPGGYDANQWYWIELRVLTDTIEAFIDRQPFLRARSRFFGQGRAGLVVEGDGATAQFDDVNISTVHQQQTPLAFPKANKVPEHFVRDRFLRQWATEEGAWDRSSGETFWHRGEFIGDVCVTLSLPPSPVTGAKVWTVICATKQSPDSGYRLEVQRITAGSTIVCTLLREGKTVGETSLPVGQIKEQSLLRFQKSAGRVDASLDDTPVLSYKDAKPLQGRKVGYGISRWLILPAKVSAGCAHLADFMFSSAPVQWWVQRGTWDTEPHWACVGRGAHLMGMDTGTAVLWSKERYGGDLLVEAFVTNAQLPDHVTECPRNLNFTLCGDGANLGRGYNILFGGADGKEIGLLKNGEQVARCPFRTKRQIVHNLDVWFYVRIQKSGAQISVSVDGDRMIQFTDPKPLREGHVALWTYATGIVLGRVRLWYERLTPATVLSPQRLTVARWMETKRAHILRSEMNLVLHSQPVTQVVNDFETGFGTFTTRDNPDAAILMLDATTAARGMRSLKVINRSSGGNFCVWALSRKVDLAQCPILTFDYRVPKDVKVNLYARIGDKWEEIAFTGGRSPTTVAAIAKVVADSRWHQARIDLRKALSKNTSRADTIEGLAFASPSDFALRAGLSGNPLGVVYHLDNFRLTPTQISKLEK